MASSLDLSLLEARASLFVSNVGSSVELLETRLSVFLDGEDLGVLVVNLSLFVIISCWSEIWEHTVRKELKQKVPDKRSDSNSKA